MRTIQKGVGRTRHNSIQLPRQCNIVSTRRAETRDYYVLFNHFVLVVVVLMYFYVNNKGNSRKRHLK